MGHSAGAFNVMSAVYHPKPNTIQCLGNIKAIFGLAGPYHFDYKVIRLPKMLLIKAFLIKK